MFGKTRAFRNVYTVGEMPYSYYFDGNLEKCSAINIMNYYGK